MDKKLYSLFEKYLYEGKFSEALLVGQNMFNKDSGNIEAFQKYAGTLLELAAANQTLIPTAKYYCYRAELAVDFFAENTALDESIVDIIMEIKERISNIRAELAAKEYAGRKAVFREKAEENEKTLHVIQKLSPALSNATKKQELHKILEQIQQLDGVLEQEFFTEPQEQLYQQISRECAIITDAKIRYFNHKQNVDYNLKALEAYERVYRLLKEAENMEDCKEITRDFFAFDTSRLFNETLVYYNHVYSYILSKMDDRGKFHMTKLAIQCEKQNMRRR